VEVFVYFLKTASVLIIAEENQLFTQSVQELCKNVTTEDIEESAVRSHFDVCCHHLCTHLPHCQSLINTCFDLIDQAMRSCDLVKIGSAWVYVGLLYRSLLTPSVVTFDPVEKISVKLQHCMQEVRIDEANIQ